jgi:mannose-1-phosphate guanylyltransferase
MNKIAVMLAGGKGTRLYPISTEKRPKQFLNLLSEKTMLEDSIDRIKPIFSPESIFINTIDKYKGFIEKLPYRAIIEPRGAGTTISVFVIVLELIKKYGDCVITLLPSDHYIENEKLYRKTIDIAIDIVINTNDIVLIGIEPTDYEVGYGYINHRNGKIIDFKEKPNEEMAKKYVENGYLWNSGIFVFKASLMYSLYEKLQNDLFKQVMFTYSKGILHYFYENVKFEPTSFEKSIIEMTDRLRVVKGNFGWCDIGDLRRYRKLIRG